MWRYRSHASAHAIDAPDPQASRCKGTGISLALLCHPGHRGSKWSCCPSRWQECSVPQLCPRSGIVLWGTVVGGA
eukprot:835778-Amphidinium_carterae.1